MAPLAIYGRRNKRMYSLYRRAGPVNWTPRFDAAFLDGAGVQSFLRYVENNPVRARLTLARQQLAVTLWGYGQGR